MVLKVIEILPTRLVILQGLHTSTTASSDKIAVNSSTNVVDTNSCSLKQIKHHFEANEMPNIIPYTHQLFTLLPICNPDKQIRLKKYSG